jgi:uncharacterized membrane protein
MRKQIKNPPQWTDEQTELLIGNLLRAGVFLSAFLVLIGGGLYLAQNGAAPPHHQVFRGEPADLNSVSGILHNALSGGSRGLIQLGLLLLVATPIARVIFSIYAFARERDRLYIGITSLVLLALLVSLLWG